MKNKIEEALDLFKGKKSITRRLLMKAMNILGYSDKSIEIILCNLSHHIIIFIAKNNFLYKIDTNSRYYKYIDVKNIIDNLIDLNLLENPKKKEQIIEEEDYSDLI